MTRVSMALAADRINLGYYRTDTGIRYARRKTTVSKAAARNAALSAFGASRFPGNLSILTMPSLNWAFERALINNREHGRGRLRPRRTFVTAIERSHVAYKGALLKIPGHRSGIVNLPPAPYARQTCRSFTIARFHLCDLRELALGLDGEWRYHGAWIDLSGPVTASVLTALVNLWETQIRSVLVLTSLRARWPRPINGMVREAGGLSAFLQEHIAGSVLHDFDYADGTPMHQIAFFREAVPA
jgi:hypothetical protein